MKRKVKKSQIVTSLFWKLLERGGTQGIQFVVQIILARLLLPEDYGVIALVAVFILVANVFIQGGLNSALIQKKEVDNTDFSSVFYLSLAIASVLYIIIFFGAPFVANFYSMPELKMVLRVLSITLFFGAFNSIQNAYVSRNMMFKKLFYSSLGAIIISGALGIAAAYAGWGVWALVVQQLTNKLAICIIMWFTVKWRPTFKFSFNKMKGLYSYGWKILVSSLLNTLYTEIRTLIIGRIYSPAMLGYYNRGKQFPNIIVLSIDGAIQSVMFPAFSANQENRERVKDMVRRAIVTSSFLIFPITIGLAVVAEPLVKVILTDKWLDAVPFLQIFCFSFALMPIQSANLQAIKAVGRSDTYLKLEIIKKVKGVILLVIALPFGIYALAWSMVVNTIISTFINAYPNKKLLDYSYIEQWKDIMPSLLISIVMGGLVYAVSFIDFTAWLLLIIQILSGIIIYILLAKLFKMECFDYLLVTIKQLFKDRGKSSDQ